MSYALWSGGDTLEDLAAVRKLPLLSPNESFLISGLADDGTVFGTIGIVDGTEDTSSFSATRGFRATTDEVFDYSAPIDAASSNGEHVVTTSLREVSPSEYESETIVYKNRTRVTLAPFPDGVSELNPPNQIRNDGTVGGTAFVGATGQTYAAGYGYLQSTSKFELLAPPGRPELAAVFGIHLNNAGSATLEILSSVTYPVTTTEGEPSARNVLAAVFVGRDGEKTEISSGNPSVGISVNGITDNDVVYGTYDNQSAPDLEPSGDFVFTPRGGFRRLEDILPGADAGQLFKINNENRAVLVTTEGVAMISIPADL